VPRGPRGKRLRQHDGSIAVVHKNPNGDGSVYYENPTRRADGTPVPGRWRATYLDGSGRRRSVSAPTRALAETRRAELLDDVARRPTTASRFSRATTIAELGDWWLDSVARHQVKTSTLDSYRKFTSYLVDDLGPLAVVDVGPETLTIWQSRLLDRFAPFTVLNCRKVCRQAFAEAVKIGLLPANPFDVVKAPPARGVREGKALPPDDARKLIEAAGSVRLGATVTLLFCQGWRVSEVLGLAWEDIDFASGTAHIRRAAVYTTSTGVTLTTTKTSGAEGVHHLAPVSIAHLQARRSEQERERDVLGDAWPRHLYDGAPVAPVFTTTTGALVNRQAVTKTIERAALKAGLDPAGLATHAGRRTVITALYTDGNVDLADIARHVGHSDTSTTAGYVKNLGKRPETTARKAAELLDPSLR
jgi:integrase